MPVRLGPVEMLPPSQWFFIKQNRSTLFYFILFPFYELIFGRTGHYGPEMVVIGVQARAEYSDAEIVRRAARGDQRAFYLFCRRYLRYVGAVAHRLVGSEEDVDDIIQETFVRAEKGLRRIEDPEKVRPWLASIAIKVSNRVLKKRYRHKKMTERLESELQLEAELDRATFDRGRLNEAYEVLGTLSLKLRIPWLLNKVEGFTIEETAEAVGVSVSTTKRRIGQADELLKRRLDVAG